MIGTCPPSCPPAVPFCPAKCPAVAAVCLLCLLAARPAEALYLRGYDAAAHERFSGFPSAAAANPGFLAAGLDLSGVGWQVDHPNRSLTLISRRHGLLATHNAPSVGAGFRFLATSGTTLTREVVAVTPVANGSGQPSDLCLVTLDREIAAGEGVQPLPYCNLPGEMDYRHQPILVLGAGGRAGRGTINLVRDLSQGGLNPSRVATFAYDYDTGGADDAHLEGGDSGSPSFIVVDGVPALVGTHSATSEFFGVQRVNHDTFVPHYAAAIDALLAADGFRLRPVHAAATELDGAVAAGTATPQRMKPLDLELVIHNSGNAVAGNLEVALSFPAGQEPAGLTAEGWVSCRDGGCWTLRRATLDATARGRVMAHWPEAPAVAAITPTVTWTSDNAAAESLTTGIGLAPSFAGWAAGLEATGEEDDPDHDGLANLLEYALGGDPAGSGSLRLDGNPVAPRLSLAGGSATFSHYERADKIQRGLSYRVEYASAADLAAGHWSATPPPGITVVEGVGAPAPDGFVRRNHSWTAAGPATFVRLRVELAE